MAARNTTQIRQSLTAEFPQFRFRVRNTDGGVVIYIMSGPMRFIQGNKVELTEVYNWVNVQDQEVIQRMIQTAQEVGDQPVTAVHQGANDRDYAVTGSVRAQMRELDAEIARLTVQRAAAQSALALDAMALDSIRG